MSRKSVVAVSVAAVTLLVVPGTLVGEDAGAPCPPPPCGPIVKKILVTEYRCQPYEATRTTYRTEYVPEKFTAYRTEVTPVERTRTVMVCQTVPETRDVQRKWVEMVSTPEERTVTRCVTNYKPETVMVSRCVDQGGHYECREVPCESGHAGRHGLGLFRHGRQDCEAPAPPPTRVVSVYVPNLVTEQVPTQVMRAVTEQVSEKVQVMVSKPVERSAVEKVTTYRTVTVPREEKFTAYECKQVPYEATRMVPHTVPVQEKVTLTRMVPVQVEREIVCAPPAPTPECAPVEGRGHGLFRRCRK